MGRTVKHWTRIEVESVPVAPHRYLFTGSIGSDGQRLGDVEDAASYNEAKACVPYDEGDVVYIDRGGKAVRALIHSVRFERNLHGDRRPVFKVQVETEAGYFSKLWEKTFPGFIQRGYQRAGLAPEMPAA